jgi:hypothetical protein
MNGRRLLTGIAGRQILFIAFSIDADGSPSGQYEACPFE